MLRAFVADVFSTRSASVPGNPILKNFQQIGFVASDIRLDLNLENRGTVHKNLNIRLGISLSILLSELVERRIKSLNGLIISTIISLPLVKGNLEGDLVGVVGNHGIYFSTNSKAVKDYHIQSVPWS